MCALLSIIIDIGYVRVTQAQMQTAADAAALEGLRAAVTNDPTLNDLPRRTEANLFVQWTFDDDMDPSNGDPDYQFGAGPVVATTDGVTSLQALQTVSVPDVHVYKP